MTMDYEKAYKKALERAATELETCGADESLRNMIYAIFPDELKESEDEKTRKGLINFLKSPFIKENICDWKVAPWLSWLEKHTYTQRDVDDAYLKGVTDTKKVLGNQSEQILANSAKTCKDKQELSDKIEPKFHEGDFIVNTYCRGKIVALTNDAYLLDTGQGIPFSCEDNVHLWTIQDAKDGDVLEFDCGLGIFKRLSEDGYNAYCHCYLDRQGTFEIDNNLMYDIYQARPATKEQRAQLKKAMADAGYEWDSEKKELKKIEQKPTWSEEDEDMVGRIRDALKGTRYNYYYKDSIEMIDWLESLKQRLEGK